MTQISRPWQSTSPGDAGPYTAKQWQVLQQYITGVGGLRANVGPLLGSGTQPNDGLRVQAKSPTTTQVEVLAGAALVQGILFINDATESLTIASNISGNPRIDTIILRADYSLQTVRVAVLQGTPAASPLVPTLTQSANVMWEIPIADVAVANGFTSIANSNISPAQDWANAPAGVYLDNVLNDSGVTLYSGDIVVWKNATSRAVTTTTTEDDKLLAGVWQGRTAAGSYGRVLVNGFGYVQTTAAVTIGDLLATATTAKKAATPIPGVSNRVLGRAEETTSGAGLALCFVDVRTVNDMDVILIRDQKASGAAAASITLGAWRTRELNTEVVDTGNHAGTPTSNQFTLAAGKYTGWIVTPVGGNAVNRCRLRNVTDGVDLINGFNGSTVAVGSASMGFGYFVLTAQKTIELQHYTSATVAGGAPLTSGDPEIYGEVFLIRHAEVGT